MNVLWREDGEPGVPEETHAGQINLVTGWIDGQRMGSVVSRNPFTDGVVIRVRLFDNHESP
jgi:hypothetical protein